MSERLVFLRRLEWSGDFTSKTHPEILVRVEINKGEALRFGRYERVAWDGDGNSVSRTMLEHSGLEEFFAYRVQRDVKARPVQVFVLCARCEGNAYAFSTSFDPFDARAIAKDASNGKSQLIKIFLENDFASIFDCPLYEVMEDFFSREDCLEEIRELYLEELWGKRKGRERLIFRFDPLSGWTRPWSRIELPLDETKGLELLFSVKETRSRFFVDRLEQEESKAASRIPIRVELPKYRGKSRILSTETDEEGLGRLRISKLGNPLRKSFFIGSQEDQSVRDISGHLLLRPPSRRTNQNAPILEGFSSREGPKDLLKVLLRDLKASYDSDLDSFSDILSGEALSPNFERGALLMDLYPNRDDRPGEIRRFISRAKAFSQEQSSASKLAKGIVQGYPAKELERDLKEKLDKWSDTALKIWTASDADFLLDSIMLAKRSSRESKELLREVSAQFLMRLQTELQPTFYIHHHKRPIKTYCASPDPVIPHSRAILALIAAKRFGLYEGDDNLLYEQGNHMIHSHGFYDAIPDIVAHGRKGFVELEPLIASACACKILLLQEERKDWRERLWGYREELFRQYKEHYHRLTLLQRFRLMLFAVPGLPPYFEGQGKLLRWQRGRVVGRL